MKPTLCLPPASRVVQLIRVSKGALQASSRGSRSGIVQPQQLCSLPSTAFHGTHLAFARAPSPQLRVVRTVVTMRMSRFQKELSEISKDREEEGAGPVHFEKPLKIVLYPHPALRAPNKTVTVFDDSLKDLAKEMFEIMYNTDGVGLSAPQVGVNVKLMVYNPEGERGKGQEIVLVNPRITNKSKKMEVGEEGCLSFPGLYADVERHVGIKVEALDVQGRKVNLQLRDWQAKIFQHEFDHLEKTLFFERMTEEERAKIQGGLDKLVETWKTDHPTTPAAI